MEIVSVGDKMAQYYANKIQYVNTGEPIVLLNDNDSNIDNSQCKHRDSNEKMHFYPNCETDMREDNKKKMKSLKQVQREEKIGTVYTTEKFAECISRGSFNRFDGVGFFHDGEQETDKCVWDYILTWDDVKDYPYVVWYNK